MTLLMSSFRITGPPEGFPRVAAYWAWAASWTRLTGGLRPPTAAIMLGTAYSWQVPRDARIAQFEICNTPAEMGD